MKVCKKIPMFNFNFSKAMYKDHELMKLLSIPRATFYKWQQEWISKGLDPKAMGKIILAGTKTSYWDGSIYWEWFWENKVNQTVKYDYEEADKKAALLVVKENKKGVNNYAKR